MNVSAVAREQIACVLPGAELTAVDVLDPTRVQADAVVCGWSQCDECCAAVRAHELRVPVIALIESRDEESVVAAMRAGASDVVVSDRIGRLAGILERDLDSLGPQPLPLSTQLAELRFRSLWDSNIVLITVVGADSCIVDANAAFSRVLGWSREELRNMSWSKLTPSDWEATDAVARVQLLATGAAQPWEKELLAKDGRRVPIVASAVLMPGKPPQAIAFALDLSESKRVDRELNERVRIATATAEVAAGLTGAASVEAMLQRSCDALQRTFDLQRVESWTVEDDELRLRAVAGIASTEPPAVMTLAEQGLARGKWPGQWQPSLSALGGFERYTMTIGGELVGLIRLVRDEPLGQVARESIATIAHASALAIQRTRVEARKAVVEAELRQAQKLEAIGRLAGGVAHDFNNLLSVIIGYARMARAELAPGDQLVSMIAEIEAAGERAKQLTAQLLAFGHRQVMQPRVVDLDGVILNLRSMLQRLLSEAIELAIERAEGRHLIYADPLQLEQVLMNLVVNSRDAITGSGRVSITTDLVVADDGRKLTRLVVSDTGAGMAPAVRARIFEPFFTTKPQGSGTGLGLSTVFGIVKQSGGSIHVDSEPGHGTRFELLFPHVEGAAPITAPQPLAAVARGTETILLCEDDRQVRAVCRDVLKRYGYRVLEAADAEAALVLGAGAIDMLLTDVVMPVMSGRQLAERIRAIHPDLPVLFMSGYTDDAVLREGVSHERVNFLQKPIHPVALASKVREVLDAAHGSSSRAIHTV